MKEMIYPAWSLNWNNWEKGSRDSLAADVQQARDLGANTYRIILAAEDFGYANFKPVSKANILRLQEAVKLIQSQGLTCHISIIDTDHGLYPIQQADGLSTRQRIENNKNFINTTIVPLLVSPGVDAGKVILEISELQLQRLVWNNPQQGIWSGKEVAGVREIVTSTIRHLKAVAPGAQVTVSFSLAAPADVEKLKQSGIIEELGLKQINFHFYAQENENPTVAAERLGNIINSIRVNFGENTPIILGEIGHQNPQVLDAVLQVASGKGIGVGVWAPKAIPASLTKGFGAYRHVENPGAFERGLRRTPATDSIIRIHFKPVQAAPKQTGAVPAKPQQNPLAIAGAPLLLGLGVVGVGSRKRSWDTLKAAGNKLVPQSSGSDIPQKQEAPVQEKAVPVEPVNSSNSGTGTANGNGGTRANGKFGVGANVVGFSASLPAVHSIGAAARFGFDRGYNIGISNKGLLDMLGAALRTRSPGVVYAAALSASAGRGSDTSAQKGNAVVGIIVTIVTGIGLAAALGKRVGAAVSIRGKGSKIASDEGAVKTGSQSVIPVENRASRIPPTQGAVTTTVADQGFVKIKNYTEFDRAESLRVVGEVNMARFLKHASCRLIWFPGR
jgi:hypothetical protein